MSTSTRAKRRKIDPDTAPSATETQQATAARSSTDSEMTPSANLMVALEPSQDTHVQSYDQQGHEKTEDPLQEGQAMFQIIDQLDFDKLAQYLSDRDPSATASDVETTEESASSSEDSWQQLFSHVRSARQQMDALLDVINIVKKTSYMTLERVQRSPKQTSCKPMLVAKQTALRQAAHKLNHAMGEYGHICRMVDTFQAALLRVRRSWRMTHVNRAPMVDFGLTMPTDGLSKEELAEVLWTPDGTAPRLAIPAKYRADTRLLVTVSVNGPQAAPRTFRIAASDSDELLRSVPSSFETKLGIAHRHVVNGMLWRQLQRQSLQFSHCMHQVDDHTFELQCRGHTLIFKRQLGPELEDSRDEPQSTSALNTPIGEGVVSPIINHPQTNPLAGILLRGLCQTMRTRAELRAQELALPGVSKRQLQLPNPLSNLLGIASHPSDMILFMTQMAALQQRLTAAFGDMVNFKFAQCPSETCCDSRVYVVGRININGKAIIKRKFCLHCQSRGLEPMNVCFNDTEGINKPLSWTTTDRATKFLDEELTHQVYVAAISVMKRLGFVNISTAGTKHQVFEKDSRRVAMHCGDTTKVLLGMGDGTATLTGQTVRQAVENFVSSVGLNQASDGVTHGPEI